MSKNATICTAIALYSVLFGSRKTFLFLFVFDLRSTLPVLNVALKILVYLIVFIMFKSYRFPHALKISCFRSSSSCSNRTDFHMRSAFLLSFVFIMFKSYRFSHALKIFIIVRLHHVQIVPIFTCAHYTAPFYFIVGMENSAPVRMPDGQREVTVLVRVKNRNASGPC